MADVGNQDRVRYGYRLVVIGIIVVAVLFIVALGAAALGVDGDLIIATLNSVVGAFFGIQVGSAGREKSQDRAEAALAALPPQEAQTVLR